MKTRRFIWSTAGVIIIILGALCWLFVSDDRKSSQLIGIPLAGVGSFLMAPELFGEKTIDKWQKGILVFITKIEKWAREPLSWSAFLTFRMNIFVAHFRSAVWVCIPIGFGFVIQGEWSIGLLIILAPLLVATVNGPLWFVLDLLWSVLLSFITYRVAIFFLRSILKIVLQPLKTNRRLRHLLMATGIAFVIVGTGLQFLASI